MARMRAPERRRQILECAASLFAERGYRGATTAELAQAAGVTEPVIYRHFESKLDLFVTLVDEVGREVIAAWRTRLAEAPDAAARLQLLLTSNPSTDPRGRGVYRVIFHAMTAAELEPRIRQAIRRHLRGLHRFVVSELEDLQGTGVVRHDETADGLAELLVASAVGYGMLAPVAASSADAARLPALLADLLAPV